VVVAFHDATLTTGLALPLTRAGLAPAGSRQLCLAHQWLAYTFTCRRFADILANVRARLGADVVRYSFIAVDLHHLLLAGLPAHPCENNSQSRNNDRETRRGAFCAFWSI
jgi:hypothetical protein